MIRSSTALILFLSFISDIVPQPDNLHFEPGRWPALNAFHYQKSNWDGTNQSRISIYFKDDAWIESIKWHKGSGQMSVIPAKINHTSFSVDHIKNIRCVDGDCQQLGEMIKDPGTQQYCIQFGDYRDTIESIPTYWHSYDFDWASLMAALIFKQDTAGHTFARCDFYMKGDRPAFGNLGTVSLKYSGEETIQGVRCDVYHIDGPGLQDQGGKIWFDQVTKVMRGFRIQLPDEDSYENVDFRYLGVDQFTAKEWETFKQSKWGI